MAHQTMFYSQNGILKGMQCYVVAKIIWSIYSTELQVIFLHVLVAMKMKFCRPILLLTVEKWLWVQVQINLLEFGVLSNKNAWGLSNHNLRTKIIFIKQLLILWPCIKASHYAWVETYKEECFIATMRLGK